ncbi:MAG: beta strand repeat-containing protein, partial [Candidatus Kapaibacteriota bacterium]
FGGNLNVTGTIIGQLNNSITNGDNTIVAFSYNNTAPATVSVNQGANFNWTGNHTFTNPVTYNGGITVNGTAQFNDNVVLGATSADNITFNGTLATTILPASGVDLGSSSSRFDDLFVTNIDVSGVIRNNVAGGAGVSFDDDVLPASDNTYNLGSNSLRWRKLYVTGSSIHIGTSANEAQVGYDGVNNQVTIDKGLNVGSTTTNYQVVISNDASIPALEVNGGAIRSYGPGTSQAVIDGSNGFVMVKGTAGSIIMDATVPSFRFDDGTNYVGDITFPTLTNDRTWQFQDASGTIALLEANQNWTGNNTFANATINIATIQGGTIDNTVIGGTTPAAGTFTNLVVNDNTKLGNASADLLTVNATSTFNANVNVSGTNDVILGTGTFDNPSGASDLYVTGNLEVDGNTYIGDGGTDALTVNASATFNQIAAGSRAITVNGITGSTFPTVEIINKSTVTGAGALRLSTTQDLDDHLFQVQSPPAFANVGAAVFTGYTSKPSRALVAISNDGTSEALHVSNDHILGLGGKAAVFEGKYNAAGDALVRITNDGQAYPLLVENTSSSSGNYPTAKFVGSQNSQTAVVEIENNSSLGSSGAAALRITTTDNIDDHLLQVRITNNTFNEAGAAVFSGYTSVGLNRATVAIENEGNSPALSVSNTYAVSSGGNGLAVNITDGSLKLSYNSQTFSGSGPYNIAPGYDVVYVTSTVGAAITINLPTSAVNGQTLYIIWNGTNDATFSNGLRPDGTPYTTSGPANLLFVYANGGWRLVSYIE